MMVYVAWYGLEVDGIFSTWEKASKYIDEQLDWIEKHSGWRPTSDYTISEEEVQ